jgi:hypothetical protein
VGDARNRVVYVKSAIERVGNDTMHALKLTEDALRDADEALRSVDAVRKKVRALASEFAGSNVATPSGEPLDRVLLEIIDEADGY